MAAPNTIPWKPGGYLARANLSSTSTGFGDAKIVPLDALVVPDISLAVLIA